jgi:phosphoribosylaminoimidazolecarboxamide formyltransferase/IMP cyclohydrolase
VKTLDFKVYLGLLTETYNPHHQEDLRRTSAVPIDLVAVNLYPFAQTAARPGATLEEARANIDIGGPCMLRAAAKNYLRVAVLCDPSDYAPVIKKLKGNGGRIDLASRFALARKAFAHTAAYDRAIADHLASIPDASVDGAYQKKDVPT